MAAAGLALPGHRPAGRCPGTAEHRFQPTGFLDYDQLAGRLAAAGTGVAVVCLADAARETGSYDFDRGRGPVERIVAGRKPQRNPTR